MSILEEYKKEGKREGSFEAKTATLLSFLSLLTEPRRDFYTRAINEAGTIEALNEIEARLIQELASKDAA